MPKNFKIDLDAKKRLIEKAEEIYAQIHDPVHAKQHIQNVLFYIGKLLSFYPQVDKDVAQLAVWWHDVGRIKGDGKHAVESAKLAKKYFTDSKIDPEIIESISHAITTHSNRAMIVPNSLLGEILRDADKLDFLTVNRWKAAFENKIYWAIEIGIDRIPIIREKILSLPESKEIFDQLLVELRAYLRTLDDKTMGKYKEELMKL